MTDRKTLEEEHEEKVVRMFASETDKDTPTDALPYRAYRIDHHSNSSIEKLLKDNRIPISVADVFNEFSASPERDHSNPWYGFSPLERDEGPFYINTGDALISLVDEEGRRRTFLELDSPTLRASPEDFKDFEMSAEEIRDGLKPGQRLTWNYVKRLLRGDDENVLEIPNPRIEKDITLDLNFHRLNLFPEIKNRNKFEWLSDENRFYANGLTEKVWAFLLRGRDPYHLASILKERYNNNNECMDLNFDVRHSGVEFARGISVIGSTLHALSPPCDKSDMLFLPGYHIGRRPEHNSIGKINVVLDKKDKIGRLKRYREEYSLEGLDDRELIRAVHNSGEYRVECPHGTYNVKDRDGKYVGEIKHDAVIIEDISDDRVRKFSEFIRLLEFPDKSKDKKEDKVREF